MSHNLSVSNPYACEAASFPTLLSLASLGSALAAETSNNFPSRLVSFSRKTEAAPRDDIVSRVNLNSPFVAQEFGDVPAGIYENSFRRHFEQLLFTLLAGELVGLHTFERLGLIAFTEWTDVLRYHPQP